MKAYTVSDKEKLGNVVVYIANHVPDLSKTKLLKLLYFMEEYSVKRFHTPFLGLPFEVWQAGPVVKDVFIDLSETPVLLDGFVKKEVKDGNTYISAIKEFCDDECDGRYAEKIWEYDSKAAGEFNPCQGVFMV